MERETITSALTALAEGKIKPSEMPIKTSQGQRSDTIRVAPAFGVMKSVASAELPKSAYTVTGLAKFLGEVGPDDEPRTAFKDAFNSLELMNEGYLSEQILKSLNDEPWKIARARFKVHLLHLAKDFEVFLG